MASRGQACTAARCISLMGSLCHDHTVKPGVRYRELGNIIQKHAQANGFSVVRSYCGHGIHKLFHTAPNVPHYASKYFTVHTNMHTEHIKEACVLCSSEL